MESDTSPTVLDLFCGAGGFSHGFAEVGFDILAGIDENNDALATYYCNNDASAHNIDLRATTPDEVLVKVGVAPADIDVVIGGPPCQCHSEQGKRDPNDLRRALMDDYLGLLEHVHPRAFVMENVPGLLKTDEGAFFNDVLHRVTEMGYSVEFDVLHGGDYHVPQTRDRLVLVGMCNATPKLPAPVEGEPIPVWAALSGLPLMTGLPNNDWKNQLRAHRPSFRRKYEAAAIGTDPYANSDQQVRLAPMRAARTVVAGNIHCHPTQPRYLTVREAATLQTFPLEYRFFGEITEQRRQVGNAVPPKIAEHVARAMRESLEQADLQRLATPTGHRRVPADD